MKKTVETTHITRKWMIILFTVFLLQCAHFAFSMISHVWDYFFIHLGVTVLVFVYCGYKEITEGKYKEALVYPMSFF